MRLFSSKNRPVHLGPYPLERLKRIDQLPELSDIPPAKALNFNTEATPHLLTKAMGLYINQLDALRDGAVVAEQGEIPEGLEERANHLKAAGYFLDASQAAVCAIPVEAFLENPIHNPELPGLMAGLSTDKSTPFAHFDVLVEIMRASVEACRTPAVHHTHALVYLVEYPRDPDQGELGTDWLVGSQEQRAAVRAAEVASNIARYLRYLGYEARAHSASSTDVDFNKLAVAAGLAQVKSCDGVTRLENPFVGNRFGLAVVTTTLALAEDKPLASRTLFNRWRSHGPAWWFGKGTQKNAFNRESFKKRAFHQGEFKMEGFKRRDEPSTFIDADRVPRMPKRADMFVRSAFGDLGKGPQNATIDLHLISKNPFGHALWDGVTAYCLLQRGLENSEIIPGYDDPKKNTDAVKAALHYLGADIVSVSEAPDWVWYSHDHSGKPMEVAHKNAIMVIVDQGYETMEGSSGDDWISLAQSARTYMRCSLIAGIVTNHIRSLGYSAINHTAVDGDVLHQPLLLLSGLGEVSRIGDVVLNPLLGPRLKSGVITTDMPLLADKPIDFGLQSFCESCNKCARECPSGAIPAGPKVMYNGYEVWKSDSEKCTRYRLTNDEGSMCGRCMKTCPWNLEGLFKEAPFRWAAMHIPKAAKWIAKLDDLVVNGEINPVKKWWWDLEVNDQGRYVKARKTNHRGLNKNLELKHEDQTLACYPADMAPVPTPFPQPIDRDTGILRYTELFTPEEYQARIASGKTDGLAPKFVMPQTEPDSIPVIVKKVESMATEATITQYELVAVPGMELPPFDAGAHVELIVEPQFPRAYSLAGDPADRSKYVIGVLKEPEGRGGSVRITNRLSEGQVIVISKPRNHFPLEENATKTLLLAGGIGVTPMIAMAHSLYALNKDFVFYYQIHSRKTAGFLNDLAAVPWADNVKVHVSDESTRLDLNSILSDYVEGQHLYTCGPDRFMSAVIESAENHGWSNESIHREYFSAPVAEDYENHEFELVIAKSNRTLTVPQEKSITDVLEDAGIPVNIKCSDGICGVCTANYLQGEVEHRDFVLSANDRQKKLTLCCSRAKEPGATLVLDL